MKLKVALKQKINKVFYLILLLWCQKVAKNGSFFAFFSLLPCYFSTYSIFLINIYLSNTKQKFASFPFQQQKFNAFLSPLTAWPQKFESVVGIINYFLKSLNSSIIKKEWVLFCKSCFLYFYGKKRVQDWLFLLIIINIINIIIIIIMTTCWIYYFLKKVPRFAADQKQLRLFLFSLVSFSFK